MEYFILKTCDVKLKKWGKDNKYLKYMNPRYLVIYNILRGLSLLLAVGVLIFALICVSVFSFVEFGLFVLVVVSTVVMDKIYEKNHVLEMQNRYEERLNIINTVLCYNGISSREKLQELIDLYQNTVDKGTVIAKTNKKIAATFAVTVAGGWIKVSLSNMDKLGIDRDIWLYITVIICISVLFICLYFIFKTEFAPSESPKKYEKFIKELKYLMLLKY